MTKNLKTAFPFIDERQCLTIINDREFGIFDCSTSKKCKIQYQPGGIIQFVVLNPKLKPIHILQIDGCLFTSNDGMRCDFAIFDKITFCFVELKIPLSIKKASDNRNKAKKQLLETIKYFKEKVTFTTKRIEAYVCLGLSDLSQSKPSAKAQDLEAILSFEEIGAVLYFGNEKKF